MSESTEIKVYADVNPVVEVLNFDHDYRRGELIIDGRLYIFSVFHYDFQSGNALVMHVTEVSDGIVESYRVPVENGFRGCDCPDSTFRIRKSGCKHAVALRKAAEVIRCVKPR